jgi:hypothetical protein
MYTSFKLAGAQFRSAAAKSFLLSATSGTLVRFVPEPDNKYDENAVMVIAIESALFIGYVPRTHNEDLLAMLAEDENLTGTFLVDGEPDLYPIIEVESSDAAD